MTSLGRSNRIRREMSILDIVTPYLTAGGTVVEIGSGRGEFAELTRARGYRYIGFEPSSSLRNDLTERGFEVLGDTVPPIRLEDECADLVFSNQVVEHFESHSTVLRYFLEANRILKPGGLMVSVCPNYDTCGMIFYLQDYQHTFVTNRGRLEHLCRDSGFDVLLSRCFLTNVGLSSMWMLDRIFAHSVLVFLRSPLAYSLVRRLTGERLSCKIYKNLYDQAIMVARKP